MDILVRIISALIPSAALVFLLVRERDSVARAGKETKFWFGLVCAFLLFFVLWAAFGLVKAALWAPLAGSAGIVLVGMAVARRESILTDIDHADHPHLIRGMRDSCLIVLTTLLTHICIELPWNTRLPLANPWGSIVEIGTIFAVMVALYLLGRRHGLVLIVALTVFTVLGIAQHFVSIYKGTGILPSDLLALNTAATVNSGYRYVFNKQVYMAASIAMCTGALLSFMEPDPRSGYRHLSHTERKERHRQQLRRRNLAYGLGGLAVLAALVLCFNVVDLRNRFDISITYWDSMRTYRRNGFIGGLISTVQDIHIDAPRGYSRARAASLKTDYAFAYDEHVATSARRQAASAQFSEDRPTIIVVMNETFADLSDISGVGAFWHGPQFFRAGTPEPVLTGDLAVSVLGGGTCNSEFEFLTGNSMASVGAGTYPYSFYDLSRCEGLVRQLEALGYSSCAIHPNEPSNWNRDQAYAQMGFDRFVSIEDFDENAEVYHAGISDAATYQMVLDLMDESAGPKFIFDVTMQNHGGYNSDSIPEDELYDFWMPGLGNGETDDNVRQLDEYLTCIDRSDEALADFVAELSERDERVVLLFFGDHRPGFATALNDFYMSGEDPLSHAQRDYQTSYAIWANYDIATTEDQGGTVGANALASILLDLIGSPLTEHQKAQIVSRETMPALNQLGYMDSVGLWHGFNERVEGEPAEAAAKTYSDMRLIDHLEFGSRYYQ